MQCKVRFLVQNENFIFSEVSLLSSRSQIWFQNAETSIKSAMFLSRLKKYSLRVEAWFRRYKFFLIVILLYIQICIYSTIPCTVGKEQTFSFRFSRRFVQHIPCCEKTWFERFWENISEPWNWNIKHCASFSPGGCDDPHLRGFEAKDFWLLR